MKTTNQAKRLLFALAVIAFLVAAIIIVMATKRIEVITGGKVQVADGSESKFIIPNEDIYKFKVGEKLLFKINDEVFSSTIKKIAYDSDKNFFYLNLDGTNKYFIPNSILNVEILRNSSTLLSSLMSV